MSSGKCIIHTWNSEYIQIELMDSVFMILHYHTYKARCLKNKSCIHIDSTRYTFFAPLYIKSVITCSSCRSCSWFFRGTAQVIFNEHMRLHTVKIREPSTLQCASQCYFKGSSFHVCNHSTVSPKAWCRIH